MQWSVIFIHGDYGTINTESVYSLDPDEWVIAAPKSSSWLSSPSTFGFNGGAYLIGVGHTLREKVEFRRKNSVNPREAQIEAFCIAVDCSNSYRIWSTKTTILSARVRDAEHLDIDGYYPRLSLRRRRDFSFPTSFSECSIIAGASPTEVERASVIVAVEQRRDRGESPPTRERNAGTYCQEYRNDDRQRDFQRSLRTSSRSSRDLGDTEIIPFIPPRRQQASLFLTSLSGGFIAVEISPTNVDEVSVVPVVEQHRDREETPPAKTRKTDPHWQRVFSTSIGDSGERGLHDGIRHRTDGSLCTPKWMTGRTTTAKCIERESESFLLNLDCFDTAAEYQPDFLRLINSYTCSFETSTLSRTAKHPFGVMTLMLPLFSIARLPLFLPCLSLQASGKKASLSASSSVRVMFSHDDEDRKKRGLRQHHVKSHANAHAGVDNAMPTDSKWNQISVESNSVSVEASDRFHDDGQSNFRGQVHCVYSILTKFFCFP